MGIQNSHPYNALTIYYYDSSDYYNSYSIKTTLGMVTYAPNADWASAGTVSTGDYSKMYVSYDIPVKDWDNQPTEDMRYIYDKYVRLDRMNGEDMFNSSISSFEDVQELAAKMLEIDIEELKTAYWVATAWLYDYDAGDYESIINIPKRLSDEEFNDFLIPYLN